MKHETARHDRQRLALLPTSSLQLVLIASQFELGIENIVGVEGTAPPGGGLGHHAKAVYPCFKEGLGARSPQSGGHLGQVTCVVRDLVVLEKVGDSLLRSVPGSVGHGPSKIDSPGQGP